MTDFKGYTASLLPQEEKCWIPILTKTESVLYTPLHAKKWLAPAAHTKSLKTRPCNYAHCFTSLECRYQREHRRRRRRKQAQVGTKLHVTNPLVTHDTLTETCYHEQKTNCVGSAPVENNHQIETTNRRYYKQAVGGRPPQYALAPLCGRRSASRRRADRACRPQRSSRFPRSIRSHAKRCSCLTR